MKQLKSFLAIAILASFATYLTSCSNNDEDIFVPAGTKYSDTPSTVGASYGLWGDSLIKYADGFYYRYNRSGVLLSSAVINDDTPNEMTFKFNYDVTSNLPYEIHMASSKSTKNNKTVMQYNDIQINASGYITSLDVYFYNEYIYMGIKGYSDGTATYNFEYDGDHIISIKGSSSTTEYCADKIVDTQLNDTVYYKWNNDNLVSVTSTLTGTRDSNDVTTPLIITETIQYDYTDAILNPFKQYVYSTLCEAGIPKVLAYIGMFGKAGYSLPSSRKTTIVENGVSSSSTEDFTYTTGLTGHITSCNVDEKNDTIMSSHIHTYTYYKSEIE